MSNDYQIFRIDAFNDNYIWALVNNGKCAIVDPGDASVVLTFLHQHQLQLTDILLTHHHNDHIGGVKSLMQNYPKLTIFGPHTERFPMVNVPCANEQQITLSAGPVLSTLLLPGHTKDHIGYYDANHAFVGDTLFSAGCGRLFDGTAEQLLASLTKLKHLPQQTKIYCAHEYTLANIDFALTVEPDNSALQAYQQHVVGLRQKGMASIPTTLELELQINPFLRPHNKTIQHQISLHFALTDSQLSAQQSFTLLRQWKDNF